MHPGVKGDEKTTISATPDKPPRNVMGNSNRDTGL
jgi:hypothetical protein